MNYAFKPLKILYFLSSAVIWVGILSLFQFLQFETWGGHIPSINAEFKGSRNEYLGGNLPKIDLPQSKSLFFDKPLLESSAFAQTCNPKDLEMLIGLKERVVPFVGFPADSQIIKSGQAPKHSKFGKRVVIEIGGNGRVKKAYCF